jgi:hypothetical protein
MKKVSYVLMLVSLVFFIYSCKKDTTTATTTVYTGLDKNLTGIIKGTLKQDSTYYLVGNVTVPIGDTLIIEPGVTVKATGNYAINISGNLLCVGTDANPILLTTSSTGTIGNGYWSGLQID